MADSSVSGSIDHADPDQPPPPKLSADASEEERTARAAIMKERAKRQRQQHEKNRQPRERSERQYESGAAKRKKAVTEAKKADANRRRQVVSQHRRQAKEKARPPLGESFASIRQREEQRLLGERFLFVPQRVRVSEGELAGQCGTMLERGQLCFPDPVPNDPRHIMSLELDASGRVAITEPKHHHQVLLDESEDEKPVLLSPYAVEPWPSVGQLVDMHHGSNLEDEPDRAMNHLGTVVAFHPWQHWGLEGESFYLVKRQTYALPEHVEAMAGGDVRVGSWVRLLPPHPDARYELGREAIAPNAYGQVTRRRFELSETIARRMLERLHLQEPLTTADTHKLLEIVPVTGAEEVYLPLPDVHVVLHRCETCSDCLVLESTFLLAYDTDFAPLDSEDMQNPCRSHCPIDHDYMCKCAREQYSHWECRTGCRDCTGSGSEWDSETDEESAPADNMSVSP
ncbi:hypothetical protein EMIHUDRAFT_200158 [Emiliania huxleyi CCMP1516]|uniref:Uncharacterized protein n=2 Tax=Emiliania huxleyi TaxID=2903 RepID=A0A0D3KV27_EMIH1|nr:hypothetical protein EMIHUDRAFT_200158 [Emiliania huxleyi CCMP1516]EOD39612.1 hypothetical protein EMIHUDRAFT_200158 [Emiliania huxleyi CCMP1516]|eukprot:XP_005792041.1 hypothetical protein EMIHUDRAFT_200158 [Emiliania huxleyi CCMP1516]